MWGHSKIEIDATDLMIIQELARDGRMPVKHLASKIGICERVVRNRFRRLTGEGIIKVIGVPILPSTGANIPVFIGFNVQPGCSVDTAAKKLAAHQDFHAVALATGPYDIVTWALFGSLEALSTFHKQEIRIIPEIASSHTLIHLETIKNVLTYLPGEQIPDEAVSAASKSEQRYVSDKLDMLIIRELQQEGRITALDLANKLGISRVSAAKRLRQILSEGIIEVKAVTRPGLLGYELAARIGINVISGMVSDVAQKLAEINTVHFLAITAGHYDLLVGMHFSSPQELSDSIKSIRHNIPGVTKTETMVYLEIVKSPLEFVPVIN